MNVQPRPLCALPNGRECVQPRTIANPQPRRDSPVTGAPSMMEGHYVPRCTRRSDRFGQHAGRVGNRYNFIVDRLRGAYSNQAAQGIGANRVLLISLDS